MGVVYDTSQNYSSNFKGHWSQIHHNKYDSDLNIWNILRITKIWQTWSEQMLSEEWFHDRFAQYRVATNLQFENKTNNNNNKKTPTETQHSIFKVQ